MEEFLETVGTGICKNCGGPIHCLRGEWSGDRWYHDMPSGSLVQIHCPGSPVAEPKEGPSHEAVQDRLNQSLNVANYVAVSVATGLI